MAKTYKLLGSNCAVTVQSALKGAEQKDGNISTIATALNYFVSPVGGVINQKTPNIIYERIKNQNPTGQKIYPDKPRHIINAEDYQQSIKPF